MKIQRYKSGLDRSYALGASLTYEMLKCAPALASRVFISSDTADTPAIEGIISMCSNLRVPFEKNDKAFNILSPKGNCFVIGEFYKENRRIQDGSHIVLVNPSDAGNLGTILRTAAGFGFTDVAVIRPAVDFYDPKTVRASMGAVFHVNAEYFDDIGEYRRRFKKNSLYAFMLSASVPLDSVSAAEPYSLIFGNEASGLPEEYADFCQSVIIPHSDMIDSLNLPVAASIAMYEFTKSRFARIPGSEPEITR